MKLLLCLLAGAAFVPFCAHAQVITSVAGTDFTFPPTPIAASNAPLGPLGPVAVDAAGDVYLADTDIGNNLVFKIDRNGTLTVVAGNGTIGYSGDGGPATSAALDSPSGLAVDASGNLYIVDAYNDRIRKVTPDGIINTIAGTGVIGYLGDGGPAINAEFSLNGVGGIAVDPSGNLYIADQGNNRVRKITSDGTINSIAGNGTFSYSGDGGSAISAALRLNVNTYVGLVVDAGGNLLISDTGNNRVRKVTPGGIITTIAGNGTAGFGGDGGSALLANINSPTGLALDPAGNLFIADEFNIRVRKINLQGIISTVAGNGSIGFSGDGGQATSAQLSLITGVAVDSSDNLYVADDLNDRLRKVTSTGSISTFSGNGLFRFVGDSGPATSASMNYPAGVTVDPIGNIYIADTYNNRIRQVSPLGIISTAAGNGTVQFSGDGGPGVQAGMFLPFGVGVDNSGNPLIADTDDARIRRITSDGIIRTIAGDGLFGSSGDGGPALSAALDLPVGVTTDVSGNLYIADNQNHRIRKVTPAGIISTIAGTGAAAFSGDGGPASKANLNLPTGVAVDPSGNIFIADSGNDRVRKVTPDGNINTFAGTGTKGYSGDGGLAINAQLNLNSGAAYDGLAVDTAGNLFIADYYNNRIRKVTPGGLISTVAGDGYGGYYGDGGLATNATLDYPAGVAVDSTGNLLIADTFNQRIRAVLVSAPAVSVAPQQLQFTAASGGAPTAPQVLSLTSPVGGLAFSATVPLSANWLKLDVPSGVSPRLIQLTADPTNLAPNTYQATTTFAIPNGNPATFAVSVTFNVTAATPATLSVDKQSLSFAFPQQGSARSEDVTVSNTGSGSLQFTTSVTTNSGGNWLAVSAAAGQIFPATPLVLSVAANPSGLDPGTYSGQLTIAAGAQSQTLAITMTISKLNQAILLSQSGLSFLAVQSGGVVPPQSFGVQNIGSGVVNWTASTSTLAGGASWLQVTPASGSSDASAAAPPRVTVTVDPSSLSAGAYYGLVRVDAPGAANSPQVLTVFLQVLPPSTNVAGIVQPAHLVFTTIAGTESPGSQTVQVYNIVSKAKSFQSQITADPGLGIVALPQNATLDPQRPTNIVVQPVTNQLRPGIYNAVLTLQFSDGTISTVQITVIAGGRGFFSSARSAYAGPQASTCTPTKLFPVLTTLGPSFTVSAGWPTALLVTVKDDCGNSLDATGSVTVNFSDGESPLSLQSQGSGNFESTWSTGNTMAGVTLKVHAASPRGVIGDADITGNLASQQQPPAFTKAGITANAAIQAFTALGPGSIIAIYGARLAESTASAGTLPLPTQLVDTQVFVAGTGAGGASTGLINLPLFYVSEDQVNAMVPYEVSVNTSLQLLVQRGSTYSMPVQVDMAQSQPALVSRGGLPGSAGLLYVYPASGGPAYLMSPQAPAHTGDTMVIFCTGLGAVNPAVSDGAAPGAQFSNTVTTPQVMVGGLPAQVQFSGLAPNFAGLYQVNAVLPSGTPTGAAVPMMLSIGGQVSPQITVSIE